MIHIKLNEKYAYEVYEILQKLPLKPSTTRHPGIESIIEQLNEASLNNPITTSKKIIHVQSLLTEGELIQLKSISNETSTKEAIRAAVLEFLKV